MFGNIINNAQIKKLIADKQMTLSPFREERLKLAHYALRPAGILWAGALNSKGKRELQASTILIRVTNTFSNQANMQSSR